MFYTSEIPQIFNFTRKKTRKSRQFWQKKLRILDVLHKSILIKLSIFLQVSTQMQSHSSYFVKKSAWIRQLLQKLSFFALVQEKITRAQKFSHKCHFCHLWQNPYLIEKLIQVFTSRESMGNGIIKYMILSQRQRCAIRNSYNTFFRFHHHIIQIHIWSSQVSFLAKSSKCWIVLRRGE